MEIDAAIRQRSGRPCCCASERIALEPVVQRIHEDDEQQRCEWVALAQAALDVEGMRQAIGRAHAGREAGEAVSDEVDEGRWHAQAMQGARQHVCLHRVIGLLDVVEERVELIACPLGSTPTHPAAHRCTWWWCRR